MKTTRLLAIVALAAALSLVSAACNWRTNMWRMGLGSWATDLTVARVVPRWVFLESTLVGHGLSLTVYTPASEACVHVMQPEEPVDYVERGASSMMVCGRRPPSRWSCRRTFGILFRTSRRSSIMCQFYPGWRS